MAVSNHVVEEHIQAWETKLGASYRRRWPSRLFRHEVLENAIKILKAGKLYSRGDAVDLLERDVAPEDIINITHAAHGYTRLYFRPRTPTQYRIEGIRRAEEIWNGRHAPVLYMFVFKARSLLTRADVHFSRGNMQIPGTPILDGDAAFKTLAFGKIYHEGRYNPEDPDEADIKIWRCAEVLCESPLLIDDALEAVVCRSDAERKTLIYALGEEGPKWAPRIRIVSQPGYFNAEYAFVESVDLTSKGVSVRFHPRRSLPVEGNVKLVADNIDDFADTRTFKRQPLDLRSGWDFPFKVSEGSYRITIHIEDEIAYQNILFYEEDPF